MIGALRHRIKFLAPLRTPDNGGGASLAWVPGALVWASVERLTSTRDFAGDRSNRLKRIAATIRRRADIVLGQRLRFDAVDYEIVSVEDADDRGRRLTLVCEEVSS